jgi:hypothetical protein
MKLDKETEEKLKSEVLKYLEKGKPDWGIPHTLASVYWIRKLIEKEGGNEKILVTVMYLHDVGYPVFRKGYSFDEVMQAKAEHIVRGIKIARDILTKLRYSSSEINEIIHLIEIHDTLDKICSKNEILVMEADSLAQIDTDRVKPTLDKTNHLKFLKHFRDERVPRFKTRTGKKFLKQLLEEAEKYFKK